MDKLGTYTQSAHILDRWHDVAVVLSPICGVAIDAPALGHLSVIHDDCLMLHAIIFPFVGTYSGTQLFSQLIRDCSMQRGNGKRCAVLAGLLGVCFLHPGDDGVYRAGLQIGEMGALLPVCPIVYGILPLIVFCY